MNFSENLINLRKLNNMSQETLAEKLNVSRQTIYKWENDITYPDMDKVVDISKIFNVSIDVLITNKINVETISSSVAIKNIKSFALNIAISIALIIFSVALLILINTLFNIEVIGLTIMMTLIFISILLIVYSSIKYDGFKKSIVNKITFEKKEKDLIQNKFIKYLLTGLFFIFFGVIIIVSSSFFNNDYIVLYATSVLLTSIAIGVFFIIYGGINLGESNELSIDYKKKKTSILDSLCGITMILATCIFFIWGFVFNGWKLCWLVFPIGGLICGIIGIIKDNLK